MLYNLVFFRKSQYILRVEWVWHDHSLFVRYTADDEHHPAVPVHRGHAQVASPWFWPKKD